MTRERDAIDDVLDRVPVPVDVELVADAFAEVPEVRSSGRLLERNPVADHHHPAALQRVEEEVRVGVVRLRIGADERRFTVARRPGGRRSERSGEEESESGGPDSTAA